MVKPVTSTKKLSKAQARQRATLAMAEDKAKVKKNLSKSKPTVVRSTTRTSKPKTASKPKTKLSKSSKPTTTTVTKTSKPTKLSKQFLRERARKVMAGESVTDMDMESSSFVRPSSSVRNSSLFVRPLAPIRKSMAPTPAPAHSEASGNIDYDNYSRLSSNIVPPPTVPSKKSQLSYLQMVSLMFALFFLLTLNPLTASIILCVSFWDRISTSKSVLSVKRQVRSSISSLKHSICSSISCAENQILHALHNFVNSVKNLILRTNRLVVNFVWFVFCFVCGSFHICISWIVISYYYHRGPRLLLVRHSDLSFCCCFAFCLVLFACGDFSWGRKLFWGYLHIYILYLHIFV